MKTSIYSRHRFHPDIIRRAIWMYFRFNLSFRDVEELLHTGGSTFYTRPLVKVVFRGCIRVLVTISGAHMGSGPLVRSSFTTGFPLPNPILKILGVRNFGN